jgi:hypothetical protein
MTTTTQELETQLLEYINKKDSSVSFEQKEKDLAFDQISVSKLGLNKSIVVMGVGAATSGLLGGAIASVLPLGSIQAFAGLPSLLAGMLGRMTIGKTGITKEYFDGVIVAGISQTVSRFIPTSFMQSKDGFSQDMKQQFKQETQPCNDIKTMRSDVTW